MSRGALTPRPGYVVSVRQTVGGRPTITATCNGCDDFDRRVDVDVESTCYDVGVEVTTMLLRATHHVCSHISEQGDPAPAYPEEKRNDVQTV